MGLNHYCTLVAFVAVWTLEVATAFAPPTLVPESRNLAFKNQRQCVETIPARQYRAGSRCTRAMIPNDLVGFERMKVVLRDVKVTYILS